MEMKKKLEAAVQESQLEIQTLQVQLQSAVPGPSQVLSTGVRPVHVRLH